MLKIGHRIVHHDVESVEDDGHEITVGVVKSSNANVVTLTINTDEDDINTLSHLSPESARFLGVVLIEAAFLADQQTITDERDEELNSD